MDEHPDGKLLICQVSPQAEFNQVVLSLFLVALDSHHTFLLSGSTKQRSKFSWRKVACPLI
ncbi:unnamed protein product [Larinioides sclopetarius]|uniref:Uncharacterized protein n=1 Tax=Larinioides sclopetarius TaxID=280406 RepID=A0AAV2A0H6_9ARAC